jgi:hypothetical protein
MRVYQDLITGKITRFAKPDILKGKSNGPA